MRPLLSICIPTYNRASFLRSTLWNWLPQVRLTDGIVELIVCDNASTDNIQAVIKEAKEWGGFQYYRNDVNIGAISNMYRLVEELAIGKYVWVVGDDDIPNIKTLEIVVNALKENTNINYIYANYSYWYPTSEQEKTLLQSQDLDFSKVACSDSSIRVCNQLLDLVDLDINCFTPIYCLIMRKHDACQAFKLGINSEWFSSIEATIPHALYIAKYSLKKNVLYIGFPCILSSYNISWVNNLVVYQVIYLAELYRIIEKEGGYRKSISEYRRQIARNLPSFIDVFKSNNLSMYIKLLVTFKRYVNYSPFYIFWIDLSGVLYFFRKLVLKK